MIDKFVNVFELLLVFQLLLVVQVVNDVLLLVHIPTRLSAFFLPKGKQMVIVWPANSYGLERLF